MSNAVSNYLLNNKDYTVFEWETDAVLETLLRPLKKEGVGITEAGDAIYKAVRYYLNDETDRGTSTFSEFGIAVNIHISYLQLFMTIFNDMEAKEDDWEPDDVWFRYNDELYLIPRHWDEQPYSLETANTATYSIFDAINATPYAGESYSPGRKYDANVIAAACAVDELGWLSGDGDHCRMHFEGVAKGLVSILDTYEAGIIVNMDISFLHMFAIELTKRNCVLYYLPDEDATPIRILQPKLLNQ